MTLVAAFQLLLHPYSGQDDIVFGTGTAGRSRLEFGGFFGNTLVLRTGLRELLVQVREVTLGTYTNQDMPFEKLVAALNLQRDFSRNPLFQVMFILQKIYDDKLQLIGFTTKSLQVDGGAPKFDLAIEFSETPHSLAGRMKYTADIFKAATIARVIDYFQTLLKNVAHLIDNRLPHTLRASHVV